MSGRLGTEVTVEELPALREDQESPANGQNVGTTEGAGNEAANEDSSAMAMDVTEAPEGGNQQYSHQTAIISSDSTTATATDGRVDTVSCTLSESWERASIVIDAPHFDQAPEVQIQRADGSGTIDVPGSYESRSVCRMLNERHIIVIKISQTEPRKSFQPYVLLQRAAITVAHAASKCTTVLLTGLRSVRQLEPLVILFRVWLSLIFLTGFVIWVAAVDILIISIFQF
ncbi:hypothetical protein AAF712_010628 [Marasmius tenuissimus]|uniref:Uncharacterized protein n=1 Tax=Marasmius tenuissimus TaxID=585030 RepID=A0ABR2ZML5_9AGAR|nr:hypothetical protein PM082_000064 [Marasmius tenuissimus]